jgi:hypothetical protein
LIAHKNAELEQGSVATTDLGQADQFPPADHDLVRRERPEARLQQERGHGIVGCAQRPHIGAGFVHLHAASGVDTERLHTRHQTVAQPAVRLDQVVACSVVGQWNAHRAAHHVAIDEYHAPAGASIEDVDAGGLTVANVHDFGQSIAQTEADDDRRRRSDPPALERLPAQAVHLLEQLLVARERFARVFGW